MTIATILIFGYIGIAFDIVFIIAWIIILRKQTKWYVWTGLIAVAFDFILTCMNGILRALRHRISEDVMSTIKIYLSVVDVLIGVTVAISFLLVAKHLVLNSNRQKVLGNKGLKENISNKEMEQD